ncbi:hypothetical protein DI09_14p240 [Mitosporidium daphniae]|uniref:Uncharacterized protein n=1 Tax=Mitosporidium daphniae TaxID=1485682 RepID=A0A098VXY6_9MICR|nr:uncharacterized protein DI09_14p240 [Mitosporidium daphniae]KGG52641.1 hypothetical protein DI09_14p240 [Mitosporidium daphniae]|eukprot:XP_013239068.1 uncharacterized protein DI09_14p240 [Mitosporidium daphniae]
MAAVFKTGKELCCGSEETNPHADIRGNRASFKKPAFYEHLQSVPKEPGDRRHPGTFPVSYEKTRQIRIPWNKRLGLFCGLGTQICQLGHFKFGQLSSGIQDAAYMLGHFSMAKSRKCGGVSVCF